MRRVYRVTHKNYSDVDIFERRLFNVYVMGLPRSGTSMMTHCVRLLGVNIVETSESTEVKAQQDKRYKENFGEYHPNSEGFFEITTDITSNLLSIFRQPYSGCKMIIPVNGLRFDLVKASPSRVIVMLRKPENIKASQEAFYSKRTNLAFVRTALVEQQRWLKKAEVPFLPVRYEEVLEDPRKELEKITAFINSPRSIAEAVRSVNPDMCRFSSNE